MSARKAKVEASYEARKHAFSDQSRGLADGPAGSPPPNDESTGKHPTPGKPQRPPSRPRILGLEKETNLVGMHQQEHHVARGEKYGFYTVVNDAYFNGGPKVRT